MKIPKIFHRIWLGGTPIPKPFEKCGRSWLKFNPDWYLKTWTEKELELNFPELSDVIARCCHLSQMSNVYRYAIILREGGIYVDTDFACLKPIATLLKDIEAFGAYKKNANHILSAIFGANPGHPWLEDLVKDIRSEDPGKSLSLGSSYIDRHAKSHPEVTLFPAEIFCPITTEEIRLAYDPHPKAYGIHYWSSNSFPSGFIPLAASKGNNYRSIPAMTPKKIHDYLSQIGQSWSGKGIALELGCWLGATAASLLDGLVKANYDKPFLCYDRWTASPPEVRKALESGIRIYAGQDLLPIFLKNVKPIYHNLHPFKGSISTTIAEYPGLPIEICIFDAPKENPVFMETIRTLSAHWIPRTTILGLLDYYHYQSKPNEPKYLAPVKFIEENPNCFERLIEWPNECEGVFFRYLGGL